MPIVPWGAKPGSSSGGSLPTQTGNAGKSLTTNGTAAAWNFTQGNPTTVLVAASNASAADKAIANYVCTGTADNVSINAALTAVATTGGTVLLSAGTFTLAATLAITGDGTDADSVNTTLRGQGNQTTILAVASNVHGITITADPKVNISDLMITVLGSGDGIHATAPSSGSYRGFWNSTFRNIFVKGDFSTHTGYALYAENPFRSTFENIEALGVKNGIYLKSTNSSFNPGNCYFARCFMDLGINNGTAYSLVSGTSAGYFNLCTFIQCEGIDDGGSSTTSIGWYLNGNTGSYPNTRDILILQSNMENFNTCVKLAYATDNVIQLSDSTAAASGTIFSVDSNSTNNELSCWTSYVAPSTTMTVLNDANTNAALPTVLRRFETYVDTSATLAITTTSATIIERVEASGAGTWPASFSSFRMPANYVQGKLTVPTGSNSSAGTGTLSSGTVTISTNLVTSNSLIFLTDTASTLTNVGTLSVSSISAGTSFTVKSANALDSSTFNWFLVN